MRDIDGLIEGLKLKDWKQREKNFKEILKLSEKNPGILYPKWNVFVESLFSDNVFWKYQAISILTNLTKIDRKKKFEKLFDRFYGLLNDKSVVVAAHIALKSSKIVKSIWRENLE